MEMDFCFVNGPAFSIAGRLEKDLDFVEARLALASLLESVLMRSERCFCDSVGVRILSEVSSVSGASRAGSSRCSRLEVKLSMELNVDCLDPRLYWSEYIDAAKTDGFRGLNAMAT
jgi:hypothetical protein